MIIEFVRNGRRKRVNPKLGRLLAKQGHVRIADAGVETVVVEKPVFQVVAAPVIENDAPELDAMNIEELRELAGTMGLTVHHRAGEEKIKADIRDAME